MPKRISGRAEIKSDSTGKIAEICADLRYFDDVGPRAVLDLASKIQELKSDESHVRVSEFLEAMASSLEGLVCPTCNGAKEIGERNKIGCPTCEGRIWMEQ